MLNTRVPHPDGAIAWSAQESISTTYEQAKLEQVVGDAGVARVRNWLGHKSAKFTLDIYGRLWPGEEDRVRDAIGRLIRPESLRAADS